MKRILLAAIFVILTLLSYAQNSIVKNASIQSVVDVFISLRDAASNNNRDEIERLAAQLRESKIAYFPGINCMDSIQGSLNGHLVFSSDFIDELLKDGNDAYDCADEIELKRRDAKRGQTADGSIRTKTCFVKAGMSTKYTFSSKGHQELAVVAEAGGLVTMKIRVTNRDGLDVRYDDTKSVKTGLPHRQISFDVPENRRNIVELEVINCAPKDCSFVIISN